jgi:hypothetical protein
MTENKEKKFAFNFIDVIIILAVLLVVVFFAFYATGKWQDNNNQNASELTYTIEIPDVDKDVAGMFKVGDKLRDSRKDTSVGEIVEIEKIEPYTVPTENAQNGTFIESVKPNKYTVTLDVKSAYEKANNAIKIDDVDIKVGSGFIVKGNGYAANALIVGVKR